MTREPLFTIASATAIAAATLGALAAFGVPLTDDQQKALLALVAVLAPLVVALVARPTVTPTSEVVAQIEVSPGYGINADFARIVAGPASPVPNGTPVDVQPVSWDA